MANLEDHRRIDASLANASLLRWVEPWRSARSLCIRKVPTPWSRMPSALIRYPAPFREALQHAWHSSTHDGTALNRFIQ